MRLGFLFAAVLGFMLSACDQAVEGQAIPMDLSAYELVDLSHTYDEDTLYWPNSPSGFELHEDAYGHVEGGWFYASYTLSTSEHGGTHLDAPRHFDEEGQWVDEIPLTRLMAPAVVIDVSEKAAADADYLLSVEDITAFEAEHGPIAAGVILLMRTDWSKHWPDRLAYMGDDRPGRTDELHFPSFGAEAARLLIEERKVATIGVDTASIDYGRSTNFMVHQIAGAANVPGLENLTNLDQLPPTGALVIALPMKIGKGSGGPVRVVGLVPR